MLQFTANAYFASSKDNNRNLLQCRDWYLFFDRQQNNNGVVYRHLRLLHLPTATIHPLHANFLNLGFQRSNHHTLTFSVIDDRYIVLLHHHSVLIFSIHTGKLLRSISFHPANEDFRTMFRLHSCTSDAIVVLTGEMHVFYFGDLDANAALSKKRKESD